MKASEAKALLRAEVRARLARMTAGDWEAASARVAEVVRGMGEWREARWVGAYAAMPRELDVAPLMEEALERGAHVAVPGWDAASGTYRFHEVKDLARDLVEGPHRARMPAVGCPAVEFGRLDFVLVPGIAFDTSGGRLGRGKGYYDRLLGSGGGVTCGVGADEQRVEDVPMEPHDVRLDRVVMPGGCYRAGGFVSSRTLASWRSRRG
ncbi:MAG: hypothetical protein RL153_2436 [Verrucomicrobiota bacterium]|jgi:5-formyltetrahydrofolate cyclo-ligase